MEAALVMSLMVQTHNTAKMTQDPTLVVRLNSCYRRATYDIYVPLLHFIVVLCSYIPTTFTTKCSLSFKQL